MRQHQSFTNNSRRIATPVLGFLSDKCRAAPITLRMIGAASFWHVYLGIFRTEALLMASSTSYLSVYRVASALSCCIYVSFVTCEQRLAILVPGLGYEGSTLLCSWLVDPSVMVSLCSSKIQLNIRMIRPFNMLDGFYQSKRRLFRESALCWFLGLCLDCYSIIFRIC
jgi:hypothetical protein